MPKEVDNLQKITGFSKDYNTSQSIMSRRLYGNDKHLTKGHEVRDYERIRGKVANSFTSLQDGYYTTMCVDNAYVTGDKYPALYSESEWLDAAIAVNSDIFGQFRTTFENDLNSSIASSVATFSRAACTASQIDSNGKIQFTTSANSPRFENAKFDQGVWIERSKSNTFSNSGFETFAVGSGLATNWTSAVAGGGAGARWFSSTDTLAGTLCQAMAIPTATAVVFGVNQTIPTFTFSANSPYFLSCYMKISTGTASAHIALAAQTSDLNGPYHVINANWTRVTSMVTPAYAAKTANVTMRMLGTVGSNITAGATASFDAAQLEQSDWMSTYIPTATVSATREDEFLTYDNNMNKYNGTMAMWVKPLWNSISGEHEIINDSQGIKITNLTGTLIFTITDSLADTKTISANSTGLITQNNWHHLAVTWANSGTMLMYLDGVSVGASAGTGSGIPDYGSSIYIGGSTELFDGLIDDFAYYDRALTADEIWQTYTKGI